MPPRRLTIVMTATNTSWSCGPGRPKSRWAVILQYCSRRSPSFVRMVFRASVLSSYLSRRLNMKSGASSRLTSTWIRGPPSNSKSLSSWIPLSAKTLNPLSRTTYRTFNKKQLQGARTVGRRFCPVLREHRAPVLPEGTLCFAGRYGIPCRAVRYSLLGGTVMLVGEYGIVFQAPTDSKIPAFAGLSPTVVSKTGGSAPRGGANLPAGTVFFVGEYGIDLLDGTVFRRRWMRAVLVGGYGILRRRSPASKALSKALCLGRSAGSNLLWDHDRWRGAGGTNLRNACI